MNYPFRSTMEKKKQGENKSTVKAKVRGDAAAV